MADATEPSGERVVVLNPVSGSGDHGPEVRMLAEEYGFEVLETTEETGAALLAERAVAGDASLVAACGGDGTVNQVVRGLVAVDALEDVTFGVVPAGTGNNFAGNVGVEGIAHAFDVLVDGERRRIDLGTARERGGGECGPDAAASTLRDGQGEDRPFVNSCICGITAEASASTDHEQKNRLGTLAYVVNGLRQAQAFEPIPLRVETSDAIERTWDGEAILVLVGNGRRFPVEGSTQANMEDGLLDVAIIEDRPAMDLVGEEARRRLLDAEAAHITRLRTPGLSLTVQDGEAVSFSLDGEMLSACDLELSVRQGCLDLCVGEAYDPDPGG
jgi:YegS/Rv2252/BmrU family lipid kinase